jgi:hypothetical protein
MVDRCCETPLEELLRGMPKDSRMTIAFQWAEDGRETGHQLIPVGRLMHEAADEIERLKQSVSVPTKTTDTNEHEK